MNKVHLVDQILLFTSGKGLATIAGKEQEVNAGDVVVVPAGTQHQFVTKGDEPLELVTVYSPAEHRTDSSIRRKRREIRRRMKARMRHLSGVGRAWQIMRSRGWLTRVENIRIVMSNIC